MFLYFKKRNHFVSEPHRLHCGTVVCLDEDTLELLLVAQFLPHCPSNREILQTYNHAIPTIYAHARARGEVKTNGSMRRVRRAVQNALRKASRKEGCSCMHAAGFCPGYDKLAKAGAWFCNETSPFLCSLTSLDSLIQVPMH